MLKIVPTQGTQLPERELQLLHSQATRYLPGVPLTIEIVGDIPLSAAGKRRVVVVEKPA